MYSEDFRELITRLELDEKECNSYLNSIEPLDPVLAEFILENKYSTTHSLQKDYMARFFLGEELYDWVCWYLYDRSDNNAEVSHNGVIYSVTDIDSFMVFVEQALGLKKKPRQSYDS